MQREYAIKTGSPTYYMITVIEASLQVIEETLYGVWVGQLRRTRALNMQENSLSVLNSNLCP